MPIDYDYEFADECAYCGGPWECDDHVKAYSKGGAYTIPCCSECNLNKYNKGLKSWFREVRDCWPDKWEEIVNHHHWRRNWLSQVVHQIRDEW